MPSIRPATTGDLAAIRGLLHSAGLPVEDVGPPTSIEFLVAAEDGVLVGTIGLERYGSSGLLRSLAVAPSRRGTGIGAALVTALERLATRSGIERLVLLTTSARGFFASRGYRVVERADVDPALQASHQFRELCPASATCMQR